MMVDNRSLYRSEAGYQAVMAEYEAALAQGPVPYTTQWVETRLGQTHVVVGGPEAGEPMLLLHGWNGSAAGAGNEFPFLFERYRVYMPDIVGHAGKSAAVRPSPAGSTFPDWVADVLDGLGLVHVTVMGISGGGWLTLKSAAYLTDRVDKAVAINPDGLARLRLNKMWPVIPGMLWRSEASVRRFVRVWAAAGEEPSQKLDDFVQGMMSITADFKTQNNPGLIPDAELQRISCPTCLLVGEHDLFHPTKGMARAKRLIPGLAMAEILPGTGHILLEEPMKVVGEKVMRFLDV
jgi:pimeloyl-ACP methyl ester carboxylesterase